MIPSQPFNTRIMDVDEFIRTHGVLEVTSFNITEPSERTFHPTGLFSEQIFGQIGSPERLIRYGYIDLHAAVLQPPIFENIRNLDGIYTDVMAGRAYAVFDPKTGILERCPDDDPDGETGYQFFMSIFPQLKFRRTGSAIRDDRIAVIEKYRSIAVCDKLIVSPAGVRDIKEDQMKLSQEDVNGLYRNVMSYALQIPKANKSPIFDTFRYNLQLKIAEIYAYYQNILDGKEGYLQGSYAQRKVIGGTRNVFSAVQYSAVSPDDPQYLHYNETRVGLFQAMKANQLVTSYQLNTHFFDFIFTGDTNTIALVDPKTLALTYVEVDDRELRKFTAPDAMDMWINRFKNPEVRLQPVAVKALDGKYYHTAMVYDEGSRITLFRNLDDFTKQFDRPVDRMKIRPLTWLELFYMACERAYEGKYAYITRYPAIEDGSTYPTKVKVSTTVPARVIKLNNLLGGTETQFAEYPILGNSYMDTMGIHASRLAELDADFDGDTGSLNVIVTIEATEEARMYMESTRSRINAQKRLIGSPNTDIIKWTLANMSRDAA